MPAPEPLLTTVTHWRTLSEIVDERDAPNRFLTRLLFPPAADRLLDTETVELFYRTGGRRMAPFVLRDAQAVTVPGRGEEAATIQVPTIKPAKNFDAPSLYLKRRAGDQIYGSQDQMIASMMREIADELADLDDRITNRIEWMVAQLLRGEISYSVEGGANFTITRPSHADMTDALTNTDAWDDAASDPGANFTTAKRLFELHARGNPTDCIMSQSAADAFLANPTVRAEIKTDTNLNAGRLDLSTFVDRDGVLYLGRYRGIDCWEYARTVEVDEAGTTEDLLEDKFVYFVSRSAELNQPRMFYGAIIRQETVEAGNVRMRRFSKSWMQEDPSARRVIVETRPLPWFLNRNMVYVLQVLE